MKLDQQGYDFLAAAEGLKLKPYYATQHEKEYGIATISCGCTFYPDGRKVKITDPPISKEMAMQMFKAIADRFAVKVAGLVKKPVNQHQFNMLTSIAYNIGLGAFGSSTLLRKVNANPNDPAIKAEFLKWNKQNHEVLPGLTTRRTKESQIYFS